MIETNLGLQQFQGQPPTFFPKSKFKDNVTPNEQVTFYIRTDPSANDPAAKNPGDRRPGDRNPSDRRPGDRNPGDRRPGDRRTGGKAPQFGNIQFGGVVQSSGGCMGCHGVAQLQGYSFSFVLLDNQYGGAPDTLTDFTIPPTPDAPQD